MISKTRRQLFGSGLKRLSSDMNACLYPKDVCTERAIKAHSIQNSRILGRLEESGHVIAPTLKLSLEGGPSLTFERKGRNKATTFTGLCESHDTALFSDIENHEIDTEDRKHLFLLAYRAVLKELHASTKSARDTQLSYQEGVKEGVFPDGPSEPGMLATELMMAAYQVYQLKFKFDGYWVAENFAKVRHQVLELESVSCLAVNSCFSTGFYSEVTDSLVFVALNIWPDGDGNTKIVFSYLTEDRQLAWRFLKPYKKAKPVDLQYRVSKIVLKKCENLVMAPKFFDTFSKEKKEKIEYFFTRTISDHDFDMDDRNLNLFRP